jgi:hypothetical protein
MSVGFALLLLMTADLVGCIHGEDEGIDDGDNVPFEPAPIVKETVEEPPAIVDPNRLPGTRFLIICDQGSGKAGQFQVAAAMK